MGDELRYTLQETVSMMMDMKHLFVIEMVKYGIPIDNVTDIVDNVRLSIRKKMIDDLEAHFEL